MQDNRLTISDLIDYLTMMLNFEIKGKLIYLDVVEELEKVSDLYEFRKEVKSRVSNLNDDYKYLNGFQKFTKIIEDYNNKKLQLTDRDNDIVTIWCEKLFSKLTWYFDELAFFKPTAEQLKVQIWKNHPYRGADMINEKESIVCDLIGDTKEIYRLVTKNKPLLQDKIREIVLELRKNKIQNTTALENKANKNLMIGK